MVDWLHEHLSALAVGCPLVVHALSGLDLEAMLPWHEGHPTDEAAEAEYWQQVGRHTAMREGAACA